MGSARHGDDLALLLVDGDNLLHAVRGGRDDGGVAWLLPRLSRWRPAGMHVVVALDGHPAHGETSRRRVATGIEFHHAGTRSADDLIIDILSAQPFAARARSAVVSRDHDLIERARRAGGVTHTLDWLMAQLDEPGRSAAARSGSSGTQIGQGTPPRQAVEGTPGAEERPPWRPGRGATRKRGNPRRGPKAARQR
jgi:nicotinamidase-related amidase